MYNIRYLFYLSWSFYMQILKPGNWGGKYFFPSTNMFNYFVMLVCIQYLKHTSSIQTNFAIFYL